MLGVHYGRVSLGHSPPRSRTFATQQRRLRRTVNETLLFANYRFGRDDVVHVIQTRFMQQQPRLLELGLARLRIFEAFCLPTLRQQTSGSFLWIIRTDPDLDETIRQPLVEALEGNDNYLLVASNNNPEGYLREASVGIDEDQIWSGSYGLLLHFYEAAKTRVYIETRLDADDGLHGTFVHHLQQQSSLVVHSEPTNHGSWLVMCASTHLEWQYTSPFAQADPNNPYGYLVGVRYPGCVTPGLTMVYGTRVVRDQLPKGRHTVLHKSMVPCPHKNATNCLRRLETLLPGALRARTPTSAGMHNVVVSAPPASNDTEATTNASRDEDNAEEEEQQQQQKQQKDLNLAAYRRVEYQGQIQSDLWDGVEVVFGVNRTVAADARQYLVQHLAGIAADNLAGQCTKGHSCKSSTKDILQYIVRQHQATQQDKE